MKGNARTTAVGDAQAGRSGSLMPTHPPGALPHHHVGQQFLARARDTRLVSDVRRPARADASDDVTGPSIHGPTTSPATAPASNRASSAARRPGRAPSCQRHARDRGDRRDRPPRRAAWRLRRRLRRCQRSSSSSNGTTRAASHATGASPRGPIPLLPSPGPRPAPRSRPAAGRAPLPIPGAWPPRPCGPLRTRAAAPPCARAPRGSTLVSRAVAAEKSDPRATSRSPAWRRCRSPRPATQQRSPPP